MTEQKEKVLTRGINHVGLTVPDIDQATAFLKKALGAKFLYNGQTLEDGPKKGADAERQLGVPGGTMVLKQRVLRIGNGANLELFEIISDHKQAPLSLQDYGWNHISLYVDDIDFTIESVKNAGGEILSEVHQNSKHEDTENSASVYFRTPWGSLVELQSIPNGYYYPDYSEAETWVPAK